MPESTDPNTQKQVKLNSQLCQKARVADLKYKLAQATAELELWRRDFQQTLQATKAERDGLLREAALKAGLDPSKCEFDLDSGTATEKEKA